MTREAQAIIQRIRELNTDYIQLELAVPETLHDMKPGQALLVRPKSMRASQVWHPYMRELWHPVHVSRTKLTVEIPHTKAYALGDVLDLIAPIGQPFRFRAALRHVLLLAYNTPPFPLLMTIGWLLGNRVSVTLVLLGSANTYPTAHLPPEVEVIRAEGTEEPFAWQNQVTTIGLADQVFAVVPPADELTYFSQLWTVFQQRRADIGSNYLFGVFQSLTPCGIGACDACLVSIKDESPKHACVDGAALDLFTVRLP